MRAFSIPAGEGHACHCILRRVASGRLYNSGVVRSVLQEFFGWRTSSLQAAVTLACSRGGRGLVLLLRNVTLPPPSHVPTNVFALLPQGGRLTLRSHGGPWRIRVYLSDLFDHWSLLAALAPVSLHVADVLLDLSGPRVANCCVLTVAHGTRPPVDATVTLVNVRPASPDFEVRGMTLADGYQLYRLLAPTDPVLVRCTRGSFLDGHDIQAGARGAIYLSAENARKRRKRSYVLWENGTTTLLNRIERYLAVVGPRRSSGSPGPTVA
jgi:hypothetical protein